MTSVGTVREIWRYPVKSMAGEQLAHTVMGPLGLPGDRGWAVRDERAGEIRGAKKLPELMRCAARYRAEPRLGERAPVAEVTLPDGTALPCDAPETAARLSALLRRPVTVWPLEPPENLAHYRRAAPEHGDMLAELREIFGRLEDEPLPDLSGFPAELFEYTSPRGTYFDAFPVHLVTTATLEHLASGDPGIRFDRRRFRPNLLVETDPALRGLVEHGWSGRRLRAGGAMLEVRMATVRCVMTTLATDDLPKDPSVLRQIVRDAAQSLGCYLTVVTPGPVAVGDPVELLD